MTLSPVLETLSDLVRIRSVNPAYEADSSEAGLITFVEQFCKEHSIETRLQEVFPGRSNLIARLPGRSSRTLLFEAHADTVSTEGMTIPPFEPRIEGGRLYGRGSCDTKGAMAALLHAAAALRKEGPTPCEILIVMAIDEEHTFRGALRIVDEIKAVAAVVSEPTLMKVAIASKGCLRFRVRTRGKAAHSSRPELGRNAITDMARVILALENDSSRLTESKNRWVGSPTLSIGVIEGGVQVNTVPDSCSILVDRRLIPGENLSDVAERYRRLVASVGVEASIDPLLLEDPPLGTEPDSPIAAASARVLQGMGLDDQPMGVPFGSDASKFARGGIPSIIVGPGSIDQAHSADEYVEMEQVEQALVFYRTLMKEFS